ncbi:NUDIX domain-containing protein [Candidatus Saccharibacteria bacterium]|nr:NUDIX domain-containing protein [Candidatus Saccharibacteria bacterium]
MKVQSAGLVVYRLKNGIPEVLMAHMGTPWWAKKDIGAWSIPKGEVEEGEEPLATARREFIEELGIQIPEGDFMELGSIDQHNNKTVQAWAIEGDPDISTIKSNEVEIEWPPKSGKKQKFPEIDRAAWLSLGEASQKSVRGQAELFERLANLLHVPFGTEEIPEPPAQGTLF